MKIQTCIQHHHTRDICMDNDIVYIAIDVYTFVYLIMSIMFSYLVYIRLLINLMLLRPIMISYNDESSLLLLLCSNWIIGCHILLIIGKDSENSEKIESVQSIHAKTDEESESLHNNIDHNISNYEMFSGHNIPI